MCRWDIHTGIGIWDILQRQAFNKFLQDTKSGFLKHWQSFRFIHDHKPSLPAATFHANQMMCSLPKRLVLKEGSRCKSLSPFSAGMEI